MGLVPDALAHEAHGVWAGALPVAEVTDYRLEVAYADMVFVDDQMTNVRGAEALGIPSVWFDPAHPDAAFDAARELMGLRPDPEAPVQSAKEEDDHG